MVRIEAGDGDPDDIERIAQESDTVREFWELTIEDARAMMADRESDGYETLLLPSGDTTPKHPDSGDTDEWGLSYIIPGNKASEFEAFAEEVTFSETAVYQQSEGGNTFIVTECLNPDVKKSLFIAGAYRMRFASPMVRTAMERDRMYSHVKKLDGTALATIEHDDPDAFFPDPEQFYAYEVDEMYGLDDE